MNTCNLSMWRCWHTEVGFRHQGCYNYSAIANVNFTFLVFPFKKTLFLSLKLQNFSDWHGLGSLQKMGGPKDNKTTHSPLISCNLLVESNIPIYNTKKESLWTLLDFFNESTPCEYVSTLKLSHTCQWWSYSTKPALCVRFSRRKVTLFEVPL